VFVRLFARQVRPERAVSEALGLGARSAPFGELGGQKQRGLVAQIEVERARDRLLGATKVALPGEFARLGDECVGAGLRGGCGQGAP
jgi:hypothetical protein